MWSTTDENRLRRLEKAVAYLACKDKNGGGGTETDPIFSASPAHSITQSDIDRWNQGGGTGDYVPMAGMDIQAGERMLPDFLLANYNILSEQPPNDSIAVGFGQDLGGFLYQGTSGGQYTGSFNASPSSMQFFTNMNNSNGNYNSVFGLNPSTYSTSVSGSNSAGGFSGSAGMSSGIDVINKSTYSRLTSQGYDSDLGTNYNHEFSVNQNGYQFSELPNAQGDINFTRTIVAKNDGTIGYEEKTNGDPLTQILGSINAENIPAGMTVFGTVFKKQNTWTIHLRDADIALGSPRQQYMYIGDISSAYDIRVPFEVMFPVMIVTRDASFNPTYYTATGVLYQRQMNIILPTQALNTNLSVRITAYFQFTNTNTSL